MNWKKFLVETAVVGVVTAGALLYAPAFLAAEAGAVILGTQVGIGALGFCGLRKAWKDLWNEVPQKSETVKIEVQPQQNALQNEKTNTREKTRSARKRWGMKAPRFLGRWHAKTGETERTNYRDAA
ncbi:MAG: hypothetical protein IKQ99_02940 [Alphaproteobacteria bacterium]|jgi:hypothetical protein|nr:hypothetical protein [Alphaproteobacteria bacterium]